MRIDPGFEELYQAEYGLVFRAAYLLCGDRAMAEDATQEAFALALERWRRLAGRSWAAGWVVTTALNVTRRALRRRPVPITVGKPLGGPGRAPGPASRLRAKVAGITLTLDDGRVLSSETLRTKAFPLAFYVIPFEGRAEQVVSMDALDAKGNVLEESTFGM